jgi:hypothetical protein
MKQNPSWEADSSSATLEIPCILCEPYVHYRIRKSSSLLLIRSQINPVWFWIHTKDHITIKNYNNEAQDNYPCLLQEVKLFGLQAEFFNLNLSGTDYFTL